MMIPLKESVCSHMTTDQDGHWKLVYEDGSLCRYLNVFECSHIEAAMEFARVDAWDRFIKHLNRVDPIVFDKKVGPVPHLSFSGSIKKYKAIFLEAQKDTK